ncbi:TrmH family RNA methyltransferase [Actinomyces wuliandei]|uniref:TrmH family RNA methyltransferase n=1 Tax=Actinomyces wuliandei TaxID=2057743 RepID=UPI000FD75BE3|nr:TrmH family RNA methyltransferase [Actinomyces wuliandei]
MLPDYETLTDRSAPSAQRIADLAKSSVSPGKSVLIEDEEPLLAALGAGLRFLGVYVLDSVEPPRGVVETCQRAGVPVTVMSAVLATELFRSDKRPDVFGVARAPRPPSADQLRAQGRDVLVLDGVRIVGNIGAIVRSAYAFGAAGVVLVGSGLRSITDRRLIRASRGYVFSLPVALMTWDEVSGLVDQAGMDVVLLDTDGGTGLDQVAARTGPQALVLGAETVGASGQARRLAATTVSIPMNEAVESLNVSVTAGILLHARSRYNLARMREGL